MQRTAEEERAIAERIKRESARGPSSAEVELRLLQLKYDALLAGAAAPARSNANLFKSVCSTDLLFLMDTTGSMGAYIESAKKQVKSIMEDITAAFFDEATVRIAVVGYKDHKDKPNIQFLDFTPDVEKVRKFLDEFKATGGDDEPEDVLGGIRQALNATWQQQTRCIIHIADAPPHGRNLHDVLGAGSIAAGRDDYIEPGSEPHKLSYEPLMKQMVGLNINYALLRINKSTDRMAYRFLRAYASNANSPSCKLLRTNVYSDEARRFISDQLRGSSSRRGSRASGLQLEEVQLGTTYNALRHLVVKSVTSSASRTAVRATEGGGFGKGIDPALEAIKEDEDDGWDDTYVDVDPCPPRWDRPEWLDDTLVAEAFSTDLAVGYVGGTRTLDDMMDSDDNMNSRITTTELTIHKRSVPFAQGAMRVAAYARTAACTNKLVVKTFKKGGKRLAHLVEDMWCQALCKAFALEFNALLFGKDEAAHALDFIMVTCLKPKSAVMTGNILDAECLTLEPYIEGEYVKYNSNSGYVNEDLDPSHEEINNAAQAFSHFTFERSKGRFLISDLQGVGSLLTDPAIHAKDPQRFKLADTNLGEAGFKFFFSTHTCNAVCEKLELKSTAKMIMTGNYEFRETWPGVVDVASNTLTSLTPVCCSNKLCSRIVKVATANKMPEFPGYYWCDACWPQLTESKVRLMCVGSGAHHDFEVSKFFYESQGQMLPRMCPGHREDVDFVPKKMLAGWTGAEGESGKENGGAEGGSGKGFVKAIFGCMGLLERGRRRREREKKVVTLPIVRIEIED
ncbi:hypothetical protein B0H66DRAFT_483889 [Apodospora peruviana]|uniref:Alpha-type protein kinase domain-containing protein n=1 Tax=Apodospora peruviana TaxID=516989 RepID=A0AAE0HVC1_9PEZI|nr:hypothetical protein B0H66DRAFT_483889 [Apodospora peruviana]